MNSKTRRKSKPLLGPFESKGQPPIPWPAFRLRFLKHFVFAMLLLGAALFAGMLGYRYCESMSWLDAFLNASMILGGMGPVGALNTAGGKFFAGTYALFSGLFVLAVAGVLFGPVVHRLLHKFHFDENDAD